MFEYCDSLQAAAEGRSSLPHTLGFDTDDQGINRVAPHFDSLTILAGSFILKLRSLLVIWALVLRVTSSDATKVK
jgi:hypothetical protein